MGDYYKFKKILIILMIISCGFSIIKNIFKTNVKAAEIVNPKETSGVYTIQYDNTWESLRNWTKDAQSKYCTLLLKQLDDSYYHDQVVSCVNTIYNYMMAGNPTRLLYFEDYTGLNSYNSFIVRVYPVNAVFESAHLVSSGITIDGCYNFPNVPFIKYNRNSSNPNILVDINGKITSTLTDGAEVTSPIPCLGCYSDLWLQVFDKARYCKK